MYVVLMDFSMIHGILVIAVYMDIGRNKIVRRCGYASFSNPTAVLYQSKTESNDIQFSKTENITAWEVNRDGMFVY
jgi:hypothetical protein